MSDFKPGEKVKDRGGEEYAVEFGPYDSVSGPSYLVKDAAGNCYPCTAAFLSAVPPADPRVDVVAKALYEHNNRHAPHTRQFDGVGFQSRYLDSARAILAALDAMPKPEPTKVRDRDGDVWERNAEGAWDCVTLSYRPHYQNRAYERI